MPLCVFCRFIYLGCYFVTISMIGSTQKSKYNYDFDVWHVDSCPMNESDWQAAAARLGCNDTRVYHCVPDKFHSSLIEFCYYKSQNLVTEGKCLELAANGILNHVPCDNFTFGCPEKPYFSDNIYEYPVCLSIAIGCFTSDVICLNQKIKEQQRIVSSSNDTKQERYSNTTPTDYRKPSDFNAAQINCEEIAMFIIALVLFCLSVPGLIIAGVFLKKKVQTRPEVSISATSSSGNEEEEILLQTRPEVSISGEGISETCIATSSSGNEEEEILLQTRPEVSISGNLQKYVILELESELIYEDIYLSLLLRRHCRNGAFKAFEYLLNRRIFKKNDKNLVQVLLSRDKDGHTLLHCAAEGGSTDIVRTLMNAKGEKNILNDFEGYIDDTTYSGQTVLHLACKNNRYDMCVYLLSDERYKNLLLEKKSSHGWNAAHFAAVGGQKNIMEFLEIKKLDIKTLTENGLNVLDIACIHNHAELCEHLKPKFPLDKSDQHGWTLAHFAAMAGNNTVFALLNDDEKLKKTNRQKTILHICCEYGNNYLSKQIIATCPEMLFDVDEEEWNALHYASKGGNLSVFKEIEKVFTDSLCKETFDGKTVLHIVCINNSVDICQHICKSQSYQNIINKKTKTRGWTAAHYVAVEIKNDETEEKLIDALVEAKIDLNVTTCDGNNVVGVACEHRNKHLIDYLLKNHPELLNNDNSKLVEAAQSTKDPIIIRKIEKAIKEHQTDKKHL